MFQEDQWGGSQPATAALQELQRCNRPCDSVSLSDCFSSSKQDGAFEDWDEAFPSIAWPEEKVAEEEEEIEDPQSSSFVSPPRRAIAIKHLTVPKSLELVKCDFLIRTRRVQTQLCSLNNDEEGSSTNSKSRAITCTSSKQSGPSSSETKKWEPDFEKYLGLTPEGAGDHCEVFIVA